MLSDLENLFTLAFPQLDKTGQQQSMKLYQLLSLGKPVCINTFAESICLTTKETEKLLASWTGVSFDDEHRISAFWGVSTSPTAHSFRLDGQMLYTWCAWDLLFVPVIYQQSISAQTQCPVSKKTISLTITEDGVKIIEPADAMITFIKPELDALKANITGTFCQYIFFIDSENSGNDWLKSHANGFLLEMNQGFELGKNIITKVFKDLQ
ncbi:MAG: organomercurial lyase [Gammaproteobacteria bacterium]|nr:organomercurial lyase [Gammaproteobacteria bacterium]